MSALAARVLRALLPQWRFFDEVEALPELWCRSARPGGEVGAWSRVELRPARSRAGWLFAWLFNPHGNLTLAMHSLLEQLLSDAAEPEVDADAVAELTSYLLVLRVVRAHSRRSADAHELSQLQFKLCMVDARGFDEDVLVSRVHPL